MDSEQLAALRSREGIAALAAAEELIDTDRLAAISALRSRGYAAEVAGAALTQAVLRARAAAKFGESASRMLFTQAGLEQATRPVVAARRAARLAQAGVRRVTDLGCGIGSDAIAMARAGITVHAVDADPVTADIAAFNFEALGLDAVVTCADAQDASLHDIGAAFCDPARRQTGSGVRRTRRIFRPEDYSPPWDWVSRLPQAVEYTVLKLAPGFPGELLPDDCELELTSVDGDVVEAAAWFGPLARVPRRASVLRGTAVHELTGSGEALGPVGPVGEFVYDPDGAVVRSHLVAEFARLVDGRLGDPDIAYVWASAHLPTPFGRCFAVDEVLPFSLKRLRSALRERGVGRLEILKRGSALDVEQLRRDLRLSGDADASLLLTKVAGRPVAVIARALP
ncbi:MAG: methyltransferase domain-containing protein [Hamadaea sp.]|uniref:class I SAM-dependent methyltransferase n=1 Tax=Hamadaea sp. TaxID=2024425 RepID=UPI0017F2F84A|nr:class I SAM-dependent methyltransferase [Hamadaea sp.]NUR70958.1 methyltransferase domain-containing protein [Hamadaea sp.]NUT20069.1 methyltransferase domain-containing protein [Hamadaea sp.]